jgi:pyruvate/2-oxoacid:ferredoxin oxidoreductase alpha subunit
LRPTETMTGSQDSAARGAIAAVRASSRDLLGAIALVEGAISQQVFLAVDGIAVPEQNAFGDAIASERSDDVGMLVRRCGQAAEKGRRVALVARASDLVAARLELASIAARRLGVVVHAIAEPARGGELPPVAGLAPALALDDLFWGMLLGAGVSDAVDLALVARRAAEDSGCPFFVVHERSHAHDVEPIVPPSRELCEALVGRAEGRVRRASIPASDSAGVAASDRAFAERVPFALGSAMREFETLTGRRHDVIERVPANDAAMALVGAGALGESLLADVDRLRASGHDVAAVRVVAWRPFPAPRLVKALGRAHAVTVLERVDQPLASSPPLATQLKAAFADALTWAPDYPGIGRIPRIVSGVVAPEREVDSTDLDAIVHNVLADERGKRSFLLGAEEAHALWVPPVTRTAGGAFVMRGIASRRELAAAAADLCAAVLSSALGLRTRVAVRALPDDEGGGVAFDLVAARDRPRGTHAPHAIGVIAVGTPALLDRGNPFARLAPAGMLAFPSSRSAPDALWAEVPSFAKALAFDRGARVVGWSPGATDEDVWVSAASFVGVALAAAIRTSTADRWGAASPAIDGPFVEKEVAEALALVVDPSRAAAVRRGALAARAVFDQIVEVPRDTIDRERLR